MLLGTPCRAAVVQISVYSCDSWGRHELIVHETRTCRRHVVQRGRCGVSLLRESNKNTIVAITTGSKII
jgi:hypothetical protein